MSTQTFNFSDTEIVAQKRAEGAAYAATLPAGQLITGYDWSATQGHLVWAARSEYREIRYWYCSCGAYQTTGGVDNAAGGSGNITLDTSPWDALHQALKRAYAARLATPESVPRTV